MMLTLKPAWLDRRTVQIARGAMPVAFRAMIDLMEVPRHPHDGATSTHRPCEAVSVPQRYLKPDQRLREHLEDALAEADGFGLTVVAALISEALDALGPPTNGGIR
jgi:hypothetical protein